MELQSIREQNPNPAIPSRPSNLNTLANLRSEDSFLNLLPIHQSESEIPFPQEEEPDKDISVLERAESIKIRDTTQNLRHLLGRSANLEPEIRGNLESEVRSESEDLEPKEGSPEREDSSKFVKVYEPKNFFQNTPENRMLLLYPFILSKYYVDSVRNKNIFSQPPNLQMQNSEGGFPPFRSTSDNQERGSDSNEILSETQKCKKISKKLKRAWSLNQQISQNVFKKVTLQYKSKANSEKFEIEEESDDQEIMENYQENCENQSDRLNRHITENMSGDGGNRIKSKKKRILKRNKSKMASDLYKSGRSLRKTTRIKKKRENDRLKQQEKEKKRRSKNLSWNSMENMEMNHVQEFNELVKPNLLRDQRKFIKVELRVLLFYVILFKSYKTHQKYLFNHHQLQYIDIQKIYS